MTKQIWHINNSDPVRSLEIIKWSHILIEWLPYFVFVLKVLFFYRYGIYRYIITIGWFFLRNNLITICTVGIISSIYLFLVLCLDLIFFIVELICIFKSFCCLSICCLIITIVIRLQVSFVGVFALRRKCFPGINIF